MVQVIPDARDVEEILRDTFLDNDDYRKRVLDMMVAYFIDIPIEIRNKIWKPKIVLQNFVPKYCYKSLDNRYLVSFWFLIWLNKKVNTKEIPIIKTPKLLISIDSWAMRDSNSHGFPPHFECGASTNSANRPWIWLHILKCWYSNRYKRFLNS